MFYIGSGHGWGMPGLPAGGLAGSWGMGYSSPLASLYNGLHGIGWYTHSYGSNAYAGYSYPAFSQYSWTPRFVGSMFSYGSSAGYGFGFWAGSAGFCSYMGWPQHNYTPQNYNYGNYNNYNRQRDYGRTDEPEEDNNEEEPRRTKRADENIESKAEAEVKAEPASKNDAKAAPPSTVGKKEDTKNKLDAKKKGSEEAVAAKSLAGLIRNGRDNGIRFARYDKNRKQIYIQPKGGKNPRALDEGGKLQAFVKKEKANIEKFLKELPAGAEIRLGNGKAFKAKGLSAEEFYAKLVEWEPKNKSAGTLKGFGALELPAGVRYFVEEHAGDGKTPTRPKIAVTKKEGHYVLNLEYDRSAIKKIDKEDIAGLYDAVTGYLLENKNIKVQFFGKEFDSSFSEDKVVDVLKKELGLDKPAPVAGKEAGKEGSEKREDKKAKVEDKVKDKAETKPAPEPAPKLEPKHEPAKATNPPPVLKPQAQIPHPPPDPLPSPPKADQPPAEREGKIGVLDKFERREQLGVNYGPGSQKHYYVDGLSRVEGEKQLAALARDSEKVKKEEAWFYVEGSERKDGKMVPFKRWYEVGINEKERKVTFSFAVLEALKNDPSVQLEGFSIYHIHPNYSKKHDLVEAPSWRDLIAFKKSLIFISKLKNANFQFKFKIVTPEGVYSITPKGGAQGFIALGKTKIGEWIESYNTDKRNNRSGQAGIVSALNKMGYVDAWFKYHKKAKVEAKAKAEVKVKAKVEAVKTVETVPVELVRKAILEKKGKCIYLLDELVDKDFDAIISVRNPDYKESIDGVIDRAKLRYEGALQEIWTKQKMPGDIEAYLGHIHSQKWAKDVAIFKITEWAKSIRVIKTAEGKFKTIFDNIQRLGVEGKGTLAQLIAKFIGSKKTKGELSQFKQAIAQLQQKVGEINVAVSKSQLPPAVRGGTNWVSRLQTLRKHAAELNSIFKDVPEQVDDRIAKIKEVEPKKVPAQVTQAPAKTPAPVKTVEPAHVPAAPAIPSLPQKPAEVVRIGNIRFTSEASFRVNTDPKRRYFVNASRYEGEKKIAERFTSKGNNEDAWIYVEYKKDGKKYTRWFEVGENWRSDQVGLNYGLIKKLLTKLKLPKDAEVSLYHQHPLGIFDQDKGDIVEFDPPSGNDLFVTIELAKMLSKHKVDCRVITLYGVYAATVKVLDYNRLKQVKISSKTENKLKGNVKTFYLSMVKEAKARDKKEKTIQDLAGDLSSPSFHVDRIRDSGFDCTFKYFHDSQLKNIFDLYTELYSGRSYRPKDSIAHRIEKNVQRSDKRTLESESEFRSALRQALRDQIRSEIKALPRDIVETHKILVQIKKWMDIQG